ncbi:probable serine/threonine-protein kinase DDB_G0281745 [Corticium candelabrum]|uniref:probable serine/threonine-protein kinase DDB_G0281745 n=1 Tax=Corticium candelabrum TaxID=121492 RepID=UPI002E26412D|nr:probable serine/threonine-protein kinase DDB_G0281745 [Corticium candelabrum]
MLGGDPNIRSAQEGSPIDVAVKKRHSEIVKMMKGAVKERLLQPSGRTFSFGTQTDHKTVIPSAIAKTSAGLAAKHSSTLVRTGSWSVPRTTKNSNETIEMERQLEFEKLRTKEMKQEVLNLQGRVQRQEGLLAAAEDAAKERRANEQRNKEMLKILSSNITFVDGKNLGEGSFGVVVVAKWQGSTVAVKKVHDVLCVNQRCRDLFLQEVSVALKIRHPNIVFVYGYCLETECEKPIAWIIMELLQCSLDAMHNYSQLTLREKVDIASDVLCGLNYLHSPMANFILHGDIRPTNILISITMTAKLGDLGAARRADAELSVGPMSPLYTAPERMLQDGKIALKTTVTDIYSMGVTLCELFSGRVPEINSRKDHVQLIEQNDIRSQCIDMLKDDPKERPTAEKVLAAFLKVSQTNDYKKCVPRKMVKMNKDKSDGPELFTLTDCN